MSLLDENVKGQLKEIFEGLKDDVTIALFTKETGCETCADTKEYMEDAAGLSDKLHFAHYDLEKDAERASEYGVDKVPAIVLLDKEGTDHGVKYNGIPAGHEINSFITGLIEVSGGGEVLPEALKSRVDAIKKPVNIKVFVTLGCPHCPGAVSKAHKLALENPNVRAEMVECQTFPDEANKYNVSGVPKIVINETEELVGDQPIDAFLESIEKFA